MTDYSTWKVLPVLTWRSPNCFFPHARGGYEPATRAMSGCNEESEGVTEHNIYQMNLFVLEEIHTTETLQGQEIKVIESSR